MKSCAIMQPAYLPWPGFFNLLATSNVFVVLDDAQFQRSSWHCRNRVLIQGRAAYLSAPIGRTGLKTKICDAQIDYSREWRREHENSVRQAYSKTPGGGLLVETLSQIWADRPTNLLTLNLAIMKSLAGLLKINTQIELASALDIKGERSERLLKICESLRANHYLSPKGSEQYLAEDGFEKQQSVSLHLQDFNPGRYPQQGIAEHVPFLSTVDLIANIGPELAREYVLSPSFPTYTGGSSHNAS